MAKAFNIKFKLGDKKYSFNARIDDTYTELLECKTNEFVDFERYEDDRYFYLAFKDENICFILNCWVDEKDERKMSVSFVEVYDLTKDELLTELNSSEIQYSCKKQGINYAK